MSDTIPIQCVRNLAIIAHIDHGKSTLADRFIQHCGGLSEREMEEQVLDNMPLERERGITIKAQTVRLHYRATDNADYQINIVDTPGHIDFGYEVSRALAACEGALLIVDAAQGVEAQSIANTFAAVEQNLAIIPVLNKIDLPQADVERTQAEIEEMIGIDTHTSCQISAKTGEGVLQLLENMVHRIPPPACDVHAPMQALVIDSWFDHYLGLVVLVKVMNGMICAGDRITAYSDGRQHIIDHVGVFTPTRQTLPALSAGEIGFVVVGVKDIHAVPVGDTLVPYGVTSQPLPGFKRVQPQIYAGLFSSGHDNYEVFRDALDKLALNDAALYYEPDVSSALGMGFRCGFLGMLHMDIVQQRLEREYKLDLITTAPTVTYQVVTKNKKEFTISNPVALPDMRHIDKICEPIVRMHILTPQNHLGKILSLCEQRRGIQKEMQFSSRHVSLTYELPLSEVVADFVDRLKSVSSGFASVDYHFVRYQEADLTRLDILINGERIDALSAIVHRNESRMRGLAVSEKMKELIPRQQYEVTIQAAIGNTIIARQTVKAFRKNVTAKCYGGDVTRKKKLLAKQNVGKKRMKSIGKTNIPQTVFHAILQRD